MDLGEIDDFGEELTALYQLFLAGLAGRFQLTRAAGSNPFAHQQALKDGYAAANTFMRSLENRLALDPRFAASDADGGSGQRFSVRAFVFLDRVRAYVAANVAQAAVWLKAAPIKPFTRPAGAVGDLFQVSLGSPSFTLADAAGRNFDAAYLFRVAARDLAYQAAIDTEMKKAIAEDVHVVQVVHPMADEKNGMLLRLTDRGPSKLPLLASVRGQLFHPNAHATIQPYYGHVSSES